MSFLKGLGAVGSAVGLPFVGPTALALGGSALDYMSNRESNEATDNRARASMDFSAAEAQRQMAFQERMSGTAHQREVADLKAAGLNPLLSVNEGASSPAGASGTGAQGAVVPEFSGIASGVGDLIKLTADYKSSMAQTDLAKAAAGKAGVETDLLKKRGPEADLDQRFYKFINGILDRFGKTSASPSSGFGGFSDEDAERDAERTAAPILKWMQ